MVGQGNWLRPPVALGKVPSYPVEHRVVKSTRTGEPVILSEHQIASGRDVPLAGRHVMVSIQDRSQDRGAIKRQWGGSLRAQSSHGHSIHTEISSQTGVALGSCKGVLCEAFRWAYLIVNQWASIPSDPKWPQIEIWPLNIVWGSKLDQHVWVLWSCYVAWTNYSIFGESDILTPVTPNFPRLIFDPLT